ncbi:aldehyde dehydrogenase family protein [Endozoicomonas sp. 4G]|uniref:aldehyde dehydrogenase family protein n=1 Tax=Endozoicomonas sp. 4G TaxID=2872754 RepID=UPI0020789356|nr:aldehyde dehydrogenase family protein [Endozoicomonas sp. 4G]
MNKTQITLSPVDGSVVAERPLSDISEINQALSQAQKVQSDWQKIDLEERQRICSKAVDNFVAQKDDIASEITWQMGRPIKYAAGEVAGFEERARYMIAASSEALKPITVPEKAGFTRYICKQALGVVLVIAPWNYPYLTAINSIMPALLAGNAVLLKHSAQTPLCAERMVEAFLKAGLPEGLFQYLHISHEHTEYLIQRDAVKHVAFTGSVSAGAMVEKAAAGRFIGMGLELGGKDPAYVRADADLDAATDTVIDGAFFNSGQSCCGIERVYVHEAVYDAFVEKAISLVKQYRLGRPDDPETTLGPLVKSSAADFVRRQVEEAVSQGAVAHIDPTWFPKHEPGTPYLAPQLLTNVNHDMRVMTEESFGPVLGIQKVSSDEAAVGLMNDSEFGLTAAIFSRDIERAVELGRQVQTGTFFVNRCDYLDPALAWTGIKNSGRGCTLSVLGFDALTRPKSFHIKHG